MINYNHLETRKVLHFVLEGIAGMRCKELGSKLTHQSVRGFKYQLYTVLLRGQERDVHPTGKEWLFLPLNGGHV